MTQNNRWVALSTAALTAALTNFHGATHPSVPNYIAMNSGIPVAQLPATDCTSCKQAARSIFNQVTWRAYQESMPSNCRLTKSADGLYVPRHNPAANTLYTTPGTVSQTKSDHYSVMHTIEEILGAPLLGEAATRGSLRADFGL